MVGKIEIKKINQTYPSSNPDEDVIVALHEISETVEPGEFVALIGPSGCGKSTLLRLIAGLEQSDSGAILIDGNQVTGASQEIGLMFQEATLYPWKNIFENIAFGRKLKGRLSIEDKQEIEAVIATVGLTGFEKNFPHQLSGGMQQRASLARALISQPKVLLFDEPLGALDAFTRIKMQQEILKIWCETKTTMVMVTHDVEEAVALSTRVFAMTPRPGKIKEIIDVDLPYPRNRDSADFIRVKEKVLDVLNFTDVVVGKT